MILNVFWGEKDLDCQKRAQKFDFLVEVLLAGLVVDDAQVALDEIEDAWYIEIESEPYQDVLLDVK